MPPGNGKGNGGGGGGGGTAFTILSYDTNGTLTGTIPEESVETFILVSDGSGEVWRTSFQHSGGTTWTFDLASALPEDFAAGDYEVTAAYDPHPRNGKFKSTTDPYQISIGEPNAAPVAVDDSGAAFDTDEDTAVFTTGSVLGNDRDADGDTLTVDSYDTTTAGGASVFHTDNGIFEYHTNGAFDWLGAGESTTDTFEYTVSDGKDGFDTATVTITIEGRNDLPEAADDSGAGFTTDEDTAFTTGSVLANDNDVDGDALTVQSFDAANTQGTVTYNGDGTFTYDPNGRFDHLAPGESATDTFDYTVSDGNGGTETATVTIEIAGAAEPGEGEVLTSYVSGTPDDASKDYYNIELDFRGTGWTTELQADFIGAADFLSSTIETGLGDVFTFSYDGFMLIDDLAIKANLVDIDGTGGVLGQAGYYTLQPDEQLPTSGLMEFDTADALDLFDGGLWDEVVLHEMLHVVGAGLVWETKGLVLEDPSSPTGIVFTGAEATAEYIAMFSEAELLGHGWSSIDAITGVPVEQDGGAGTAGGHWDEQIFADELMTGYLNGSGMLTDLTLASLSDIGYDVTGFGDTLLV